MSQFHQLTISEIRRETSECVSIVFDIPPELRNIFRYQAGQNLTLRLLSNGKELRRSYSICSSPLENELRVAVKKIPEGRFSSIANVQLKPGDTIEVLPPGGRFGIAPNHSSENREAKQYLAFVAGSGITPVISIIKTVLASEENSSFTLVYGNRNRNSIIFREQLEALKNKYLSRLSVHHILSREIADAPVHHGRIDIEKCELLAGRIIHPHAADHIFLCGPEEMIFTVRDWLLSKGVQQKRIHFELFTVPGQKTAVAEETTTISSDASARVTLKLDGSYIEFTMPYEGYSILDAALRQGADLPFACKGGVCATCKAKLLKGEVQMDKNYALEDDELEAGYILTCQSHPRSSEITVDFDIK